MPDRRLARAARGRGHTRAWGPLTSYPDDEPWTCRPSRWSRSISRSAALYTPRPWVSTQGVGDRLSYTLLTYRQAGAATTALPCYDQGPQRSDHRAARHAIVKALNPRPGQWSVIQMFHLCRGEIGTLGQANAWDCFEAGLATGGLASRRNYCRKHLPDGARPARPNGRQCHPAQMATRWGRTPSGWADNGAVTARPIDPTDEETRAPYDPMPHGPGGGRPRTMGRRWPTDERYDADLLRHGDRHQCGGPLPLLDDGGDRRRSRCAGTASTSPSRNWQRLQYRHHRPDSQCAFSAAGVHRRQSTLEPAWGDGHRSLSTRARTLMRKTPRGLSDRAGGAAVGRRSGARQVGDPCPNGCAFSSGRRSGTLRRRPRICAATFSIAQFGSTRSINASLRRPWPCTRGVREHADFGARGVGEPCVSPLRHALARATAPPAPICPSANPLPPT